MAYRYPYKSKLKSELHRLKLNQDYFIWQSDGLDLQGLVNTVDGHVIEIGGPTDRGFLFLDKITFNSKPVITNIEKVTGSVINQVVDATDMPYDNESVGVLLMATMSISSDWWTSIGTQEIDNNIEQIEKEFDVAKLEMGQIAAGTLRPDDALYALRIKIYTEAYRTLKPGGLFFTDGHQDELQILKKMGFKLLTYFQEHVRTDQGWQGVDYEFVVRK